MPLTERSSLVSVSIIFPLCHKQQQPQTTDLSVGVREVGTLINRRDRPAKDSNGNGNRKASVKIDNFEFYRALSSSKCGKLHYIC